MNIGFSQEDQGIVIEDFLHQYYARMSDRDWKAYRTFFIDKAILASIWNPDGQGDQLFQATIDEFIAKTPEGPDSQPIFDEQMISSQVEVHGDMATAWVKYKARFGTEDNLNEWEGTDLFTLIRTGEGWRIVSLTYLSD